MIKQILAVEFEKLKADLLSAYQSSGQSTSGTWGDSLEIVELPNGFRLMADGYILGRKPGRQPPSKAIELWLQQKGIAAQAEKNISTSSLAHLIARKIAREGWQPKQPHFTDIVITPQRIQQMLDTASGIALADFMAQLTAFIKTIAV